MKGRKQSAQRAQRKIKTQQKHTLEQTRVGPTLFSLLICFFFLYWGSRESGHEAEVGAEYDQRGTQRAEPGAF